MHITQNLKFASSSAPRRLVSHSVLKVCCIMLMQNLIFEVHCPAFHPRLGDSVAQGSAYIHLLRAPPNRHELSILNESSCTIPAAVALALTPDKKSERTVAHVCFK